MSIYRVSGRYVWSNWLFYCILPCRGDWLWRRLARPRELLR